MKSSLSKNTEQEPNSDSSKEMVEKIQVPETPFTMVRFEDKWFLTMGKYRLTEPADTKEEIEAQIENTSWNRIIQIILIIIKDHDEEKQLKLEATQALNAHNNNKSNN